METLRFWMRPVVIVVCLLAVSSGRWTSAAQFVQGALGQVPAPDAAALGATVGCRYYSISGPDSSVNLNTCGSFPVSPCCPDYVPGDPQHQNHVRCIRNFNTSAIFGGAG